MPSSAVRRPARAGVAALALLLLAACTSGTGGTPGQRSTDGRSGAASLTGGLASAEAALVTRRKPGWALDRIDQRRRPLDAAFTVRNQGRGVTVYVVDGNFDPTNAELGGRASTGLRNGRGCMLESGIDHGLFVAGIVGGRTTGVAPQVRLVSVGAFDGCEGGSRDATKAQQVTRIVRALDWVATHARRPAVANLSLNVSAPAPRLRAAVARVVDAGVTVVASAGNAGEDACRFPPAGLPSVVTVAASTRRDRDAGLDHGRCVDLYAPGESVRSVVSPQLDPDRVVDVDGAATSWAAPYVSGAAALHLSRHPKATPAAVRRWLIDRATTGAVRGDRRGSPDRLLHVGGL